jgi:hypothetical protein
VATTLKPHAAQQRVELLKGGGPPALDVEPVFRGPIRLDTELDETLVTGVLVMLGGTRGEMRSDLGSRRHVPA